MVITTMLPSRLGVSFRPSKLQKVKKQQQPNYHLKYLIITVNQQYIKFHKHYYFIETKKELSTFNQYPRFKRTQKQHHL